MLSAINMALSSFSVWALILHFLSPPLRWTRKSSKDKMSIFSLEYNLLSGIIFGSSTSFFNAPYGDYWEFMRKICTTELLGTRQMKKLKTRSARCSGEDNQAEKCKGLVIESFDLARKLALFNVIGPLKRIDMWYLRNKIADVTKRYDELFENVLVEHEEKAKREGPNMENKDLMGDSNTTSDVILWILAEIVNHPAAFKKVREDIDSVVGTERLVDEADIQNLPYFQACVKEAMRLHPANPLFDRVCRENCKLAGYDIPKGITMIMNSYSIMRDPKIWDSPNDFIPKRFLTEKYNAKEQNFQVYVPFGGGRRMCPGINMTSSVINCSVTAMVQCFDWKVIGGDGPDG
ncbi:hypothetical protein SADUNF_Sadunf09G0051800 [Salix dunnii]|uniref:Cytochrome P450 n=1 Tax=Salix dunnii TaxID=1413687 RepID=A0A835JT36_9ROSI|nr:hypothetical protein SADUNF_Sadunf09G0051800 [Salix dunnii]